MSNPRIAANRANAQLSTGPRSAAGKSRSRMNAVKHGFATRDVLGDPLEEFRAVQRWGWACLQEAERRLNASMEPSWGQSNADLADPLPGEVLEALHALGRVDRYRRPRLRAWLKTSLNDRGREPDLYEGGDALSDFAAGRIQGRVADGD